MDNGRKVREPVREMVRQGLGGENGIRIGAENAGLGPRD